MKRISDDSIRRVVERCDIVNIVGDFVRLSKKGGRYWGLCPFHNEKTPSFSVDGDKGFFYCFGCQKGGNVITFLMEIDKMSFPEALETAAKRAGVEIAVTESAPEDKHRVALLDLYRKVASAFAFILTNKDYAKAAKEYLLSRSLTEDTLKRFQIGFAPADRKWLYKFLLKKGYSPDFLGSSGLFSRRFPELSFFSDRVIFPITNARGEIIAFGGRTLRDSEPKYINSPDSPIFSKSDTLFALSQALLEIKKTGTFMLVEGYMDAISLHQAGVPIAIAPLGTSFTLRQASLLKRYAVRGTLLFDSDPAGQKAAKKAISVCERAGISTDIAILSSGKDASEILQKFGGESLGKMVKTTINSLEYLVKDVLSLYDINTVEGKALASKEMFSYIELFDSEVKQDASLTLLADRLGIDKNALLRDFRKPRSGRTDSGENARPDVQSRRMNADMFFVISLVANRGLFDMVRSQISSEDIVEPDARNVFIALEESFRNDESDIESLLSRIDDEALRNLVFQKSSSDEFSLNQEKLIEDGMRAIRIRSLERKRVELQRRMKGIDGDTVDDRRSLEEIMAEKMFMDDELRKLKGNVE